MGKQRAYDEEYKIQAVKLAHEIVKLSTNIDNFTLLSRKNSGLNKIRFVLYFLRTLFV